MRDASNHPARYCARLVAKGFTQRRGIDYIEVFSRVAKYTTVRFLLSLSAQEGLEIISMDIKAAFLNGDLDEQIYMHQPERFVVEDKEDSVYLLNKAIYGLKQASRQW